MRQNKIRRPSVKPSRDEAEEPRLISPGMPPLRRPARYLVSNRARAPLSKSLHHHPLYMSYVVGDNDQSDVKLRDREDEVALRVLVVGSLRDSRFKDDEFIDACRELGAALARAGMEIAVGI